MSDCIVNDAAGQWHEITLTDSDGEQWKARQRTGIGAGPTDEEMSSQVKFTSLRSGELLTGRVSTLDAADDTELPAALEEAKSLRDHGR